MLLFFDGGLILKFWLNLLFYLLPKAEIIICILYMHLLTVYSACTSIIAEMFA